MIGLLAAALMAATPELELKWTAPVACPDRSEVELRIADLAGRPVRVGAPADWTVSVDVRRTPEGFSAEVELRTLRGTELRPLASNACEGLADAVAVIVALALDEPRAEAPPGPAAVARVAPRVVRPRVKQRSPALRWRAPWAVSLAGELTGHLGLPGGALGAGGHFIARRGDLSAHVGAVVRKAPRREVATGQWVQVGVGSAILKGCALVWAGYPWGVDACLLGELGGVEVAARGRAVGSEVLWWSEAGLELAFGFETSASWSASFGTQLRVAIARPSAVISLTSGAVEAFRARPVSFAFTLNLRRDVFVTD